MTSARADRRWSFSSGSNLIAQHLIENGGAVGRLSARDKQNMIAMTAGTEGGLPWIIKRIDAFEESTAVVGANSLIAAITTSCCTTTTTKMMVPIAHS